MKTKINILALFLTLFISRGIAQKNSITEAEITIESFIGQDNGINAFLNSAYGFVVFPGIGKGAIGVGGAGGKGTVFNQGTAVADANMVQVTIGLQAGGQKYAEIIFFEDKDAYDRFVGNNFEFAAQASAVALKSGASADAKYRNGTVVFTMAIGGLMYEASVGGQKFKVKLYE